MGGIAGIFHVTTRKPVDPARVAAMARGMAHRGLDPAAVWTGPGVGLCGSGRASLIEPALHVAFDGRLDNRDALRADFDLPGGDDAALVLHAWRRWGAECLSRLEGTFAFALHDPARGSLFLARDRLGVKPLHYTLLSDGAVLFASELRGLLVHPLLRPAPDLTAIEDYLALGHVPDDSCLVAGIEKLPAGHHLLLRLGRSVPSPTRWWALNVTDRARGSAATFSEQLTERLRAAVHRAMADSAPAGALLDDSVEAAAIVALMAEHSPGAIETCAVGFDEAASTPPVAARFATHHRYRRLVVGEEGFPDEPFADPAAWMLAPLCRFGRERTTSMLTGTGGEEALSTHRRHAAHRRDDRLRRLLPEKARRWAGLVHPPLGHTADEAYAEAMLWTDAAGRAAFYNDKARRALAGYRAEERYLAALRASSSPIASDRAYFADCTLHLPGAVLAPLDRAGMAAGLDVRAPLLDHRLLPFLATVPPALRGRRLLRRALRRHLPQEIGAEKVADTAPSVSQWLRGPLAAELGRLPRGSALAQTDWFEAETLARLVAEHGEGVADHGRFLWQMLMLDRALARLFGLGPTRQAG